MGEIMKNNFLTKIAWIASLMTIFMFSSYIDQIRLNLSGQVGSVILPIATIFNCAAWFSYGFFRTKIEWPIVICNLFGIVLGFLTFVTALI
jgi:uncharacterized protein with PQ loop repeat